MKIPLPTPPSPHTTWQSTCTCTVTTHQGQSLHSISSQTRDLGDAESWIFEDLLPNYSIRVGVKTGRATIYDKGEKDLELEIQNSLMEGDLDKTHHTKDDGCQDDSSKKAQRVNLKIFCWLADKLNVSVAASLETNNRRQAAGILKLRDENEKLKAMKPKPEEEEGGDELGFQEIFYQQCFLLIVTICCILLALFGLFVLFIVG